MKYTIEQLVKKIAIIGVLLINFVAKSSWADAARELKIRLDKIDTFYAKFTQKVIDSNGNILQEGYGDLWVKRPNLFNWHMIQPYESILISDGETLWFYDPFVKQVTAIWLKEVNSNMPFMLITRNQPSDWEQYNIEQVGDDFELIPKGFSGNLKQFNINVSKNGIINQFGATEQENQYNNYQFDFHKNIPIDRSKFSFILPQDLTIDDQRN